jgi:hypothetical protein
VIDSYQDIINSLNVEQFDFDYTAKRIFNYQRTHNPIYRHFLDLIGYDQEPVTLRDYPFCPISTFKHHDLKSEEWGPAERCFMSSGTGGVRSKHYVRDLNHYHKITERIFEQEFGSLKDYQILGLLPHYSDNPQSSLLSMVEHFMNCSAYEGMTVLSDLDTLFRQINDNKDKGVPTLVIGVSFALLDYANKYQHELNDSFLIIETGGMKKYKREMSKEVIHKAIRDSFSGAKICSEYGMTECLAQAYSKDSTWIRMNDYFKVVITDPTDPRQVLPEGRTGRINIIDLANVSTLSFIATDDIGKVSTDDPELFQVLGRLSNTDLRGCNYLI